MPHIRPRCLEDALKLKSLEIYDGLPFKNDTDTDDVEKALGLLKEYYVGKVNVMYKRATSFIREINCREKEQWRTAVNCED